MPTTKKTRTTQQQRARQEQWKRRVESQMGGEQTRPVSAPPAAIVEDAADEGMENSGGYQQAAIRPMPANVSTASTASAARNTPRAGGAAMPTAGQRRAIAASRATRARVAMNTLSLDEEMHYVRADIRKLITLTVACLAIIIVLAFVLNR